MKVAGEHEEDVDGDTAGRETRNPRMRGEDGEHGHAAQAVQGRNMPRSRGHVSFGPWQEMINVPFRDCRKTGRLGGFCEGCLRRIRGEADGQRTENASR